MRARTRLTLLVAVVALLVLPASALAGTRTINFDDVTAPTLFSETGPLTDRYSSLGVTFSGPEEGAGGAILDSTSFMITGESPPNFLAYSASATYSSGKGADGPGTISFASPIHSASINAGQSSGGTVTVTAFDGSTPVSSSFRTSAQEVATLSVQATRITSLRLEFTGTAVGFDDLVWATSPVSPNDAFQTGHNTALSIPARGVLANDSDADADPLTAVLSRGAANGTVQLLPDGSFTYTPRQGFSGVDSFGYRANDGGGNGDEANVTVQVAAPPPPPPPLLPSSISSHFLGFKKFTKVDRLSVSSLPAGGRVVVQCKSKKKRQQKKSCPYKSKTFKTTAARAKLNLLKPFRKKKFAGGTRITITMTAPGFIGKRFTFTTRNGRKTPKPPKRQCIPPGGKPGKCT